MPNWITSVPAATAIIDADLLDGVTWARSPNDRALSGVGLRGSAAAGDTEVEIYIDEVRVGTFFNNNTGFPNNDDLLPLDRLFVPASAQLRAIVRDAATTNPINTMIAIGDV
jgi:hypothetical protein